MIVAYQDDVGFGGKVEVVVRDLVLLPEMSAQRSLTRNKYKCDMIRHSIETGKPFTSLKFVIPETDFLWTVMLVASLFLGASLDNVLANKREKLQV